MPTRAQTNLNGVIKSLGGLEDDDLKSLESDGIKTTEDLSFIKFDDFNTQINVLKRRKLDLVRQYLEMENHSVTTSTTMEDIKKYVDGRMKTAASHATVNTNGIDVNCGAPKVYIDHLKEFSGDSINYEEWEGAVEATLKQTHYKDYLNQLPATGNVWEQARNQELYNMILSAVRKGHAFNLVEKVKEDLDIGRLRNWKDKHGARTRKSENSRRESSGMITRLRSATVM
mmetsp:Transcript_3618/g.6841  ORF Transcript_3618/g.6841 Transcript_3618/m.6841 type:complete len:229 (+) Transcript_3618:118-804(+)